MFNPFQDIIDKKIPAKILYEDDLCLCFPDIEPQAPHHLLIIPKQKLVSLDEAKEKDKELLGHLLWVTQKVAREVLKISQKGYRVVINTGHEGGQSVFHLHLHLLGGRDMKWPPG